jgi:hypothetical protein
MFSLYHISSGGIINPGINDNALFHLFARIRITGVNGRPPQILPYRSDSLNAVPFHASLKAV